MARVSEYRMHLLKNFAIIMFSLHRSCLPKEIDPVPPTSLSINGAYITLYGYASKGPKLDRHMSRSMLHCSHLCLKNTRCISFNYQVSFPRSGLCELSEEGILSKERREMLRKMPGFVFVQTERKDLVRFEKFIAFWCLVTGSICIYFSRRARLRYFYEWNISFFFERDNILLDRYPLYVTTFCFVLLLVWVIQPPRPPIF